MHGKLTVGMLGAGALTLLLGCGSNGSSADGSDAAIGGSAANGGSTASGGSMANGGSAVSGGTGGASNGDAGNLEPPPGEYGTRADLLEANSEAAAAQLGSTIYVIGGYPSTRQVQATVQVYDATTDSWELSDPVPVAIHHPMAVGVDGKLYVFGGEIGDGTGPATNQSYVYDPATGIWDDLPSMPTARSAGAAVAIDDKIYVVGGRPPAGNAFEVYDIGDDVWQELPRPTHDYNERNHLIAVAIDGVVYLAGGRYDGGGFSSPMTDTLEVFDPAVGQWEPRQPLPRPRGGINGVAAEGCFHVFGGEGANIGEPNNVFPDHDVYNPLTNTWTSLDPLPIPVHGVTGAAYIDGLIHMPGGGTQQGGNSGSVHHQVYRVSMACQ